LASPTAFVGPILNTVAVSYDVDDASYKESGYV
jgi:hypothetical protein